MPSTATRFALRAGATATVAAVIIGGAALPANAAATDVTQAEGRLLAGSGTVDLDTIDGRELWTGAHETGRRPVATRTWDAELDRTFAEPVEAEQRRGGSVRDEGVVPKIEQPGAQVAPPVGRLAGEREAA